MRIAGEKYYTSLILVAALVTRAWSRRRDKDRDQKKLPELEGNTQNGPVPPGPVPGFNITSIGSYVSGPRLEDKQPGTSLCSDVTLQ